MTRPVEAEHERLPRAARIRRTRDIRAVLRRGTRRSTPALDVFVLPPPSGPPDAEKRLPRVGWVVPKLGNGIVARNRLKRRLRDIGRRRVLAHLRESGCGADVLVRVRRKGYRATYGQLEDQWMSVVERTCSKP
ncbi:MAG: ribonuclease P protein component [Gemmatimonadota bacterium]|nr:ribonuclease P protein component [Gemmatimonadota bacterium]MDE2984655.1 ribonuclease P protein component [Gemmatimonadota bacterium]